eukprot:g4273.t1
MDGDGAGAQVPRAHPKLLRCSVKHARKLKDTQIFGRQDPYVKVMSDGRNPASVHTRAASSGGTRPTWGKGYVSLKLAEDARYINMEVWNKNTWNKDDLIGKTPCISLTRVKSAAGSVTLPVHSNRSRKRGTGTITVEFSFPAGENERMVADASNCAVMFDGHAQRRCAAEEERAAACKGIYEPCEDWCGVWQSEPCKGQRQHFLFNARSDLASTWLIGSQEDMLACSEHGIWAVTDGACTPDRIKGTWKAWTGSGYSPSPEEGRVKIRTLTPKEELDWDVRRQQRQVDEMKEEAQGASRDGARQTQAYPEYLIEYKRA